MPIPKTLYCELDQSESQINPDMDIISFTFYK